MVAEGFDKDVIGYTRRVPRFTSSCLALTCSIACARAIAPPVHTGAVATVPVISSSVAATPSGVPAPSEPPKLAVADFRLVREFDGDCAYLHVLQDKVFISCHQDLYVLEGDEIRTEPALQRGIEPEEPSFLWGIGGIAGTFPTGAWLGENRTTASSAYGEFFKWTGERWAKVDSAKRLGLALWELLPWTDQRAIAVVQPALGFGARLIPLGDKPFPVPKFTRPALFHERCKTRMQVQVATSLAPGDAMVAGWACDVTLKHGILDVSYSGLGVERLRVGSSVGEFSVLADLPEDALSSGCQATDLVALAPDSVFLAAHCRVNRDNAIGYFAHYDGTRFVENVLPINGIVKLIWHEEPNIMWVVDLENHLWRGVDADWARIPWDLPDNTEITQGWSRGPNDLWIVTQNTGERRSAVYHGHSLKP